MKRKLLIVILAFASVFTLAFGLSACSGNSGNGNTSTGGGNTEQGGGNIENQPEKISS